MGYRKDYPQRPQGNITWVDTLPKCRQVCQALFDARAPIAVDLEGVNLCRDGRLCLMQIASVSGGPVYLFDIVVLGRRAFEVGLTRLLEDVNTMKLFFDARADADILSHQFGIVLQNVRDLQVLSCAVLDASQKTEYLQGLDKVAQKLDLPAIEKDRLKLVKEKGREIFVCTESQHQAWCDRPLVEELKQYAANDVLMILCIYHQWYEQSLDSLVADISQRRIQPRGKLAPMARVYLVRMLATDMNGKVGTVVQWVQDCGGRWVVRMDEDGDELRMKSENLSLSCPPLQTDAYRDFPLPDELRTVQVCGLGPQACKSNLQSYFQRFGAVGDVQLKDTEAIVSFNSAAGAQAAVLAKTHPRMGPHGGAVEVDWPTHVLQFCPQYIDAAPKATASSGDGQRYLGSIKSFDRGKGFGFIESDATHRIYGNDVFLHSSKIGGCQVGSQVSFTICLNSRGQPQAKEVTPLVLDQRFVGHVKRINTEKGYGFITCSELFQLFGNDVYFRLNDQFEIGQEVSFAVSLNQEGQPQASSLAVVRTPSPIVARRFVGLIKFYNAGKGFGFITCDETYAIHGSDIYLTGSEIGNLQAGNQVSFLVQLNGRGQPQAKDVRQISALQ